MTPDYQRLGQAVEALAQAAWAYDDAQADLAAELRRLQAAGVSVSALAERTGYSRPTVYRLLRSGERGAAARLLPGGGRALAAKESRSSRGA